MLFPADYVERWGERYGIGLGSVPVSEALIVDYSQKPIEKPDGSKVFPVATCRAAIMPVEVEQSVYDEKKAIIHADDGKYNQRMPIMEQRQKANKGLAYAERKKQL
jgi:hypothetical protein